MSIERLIESIGLSAPELKRYVLAEVDEFLEARDPDELEGEFGDIIFALMAMGWAHAGRHFELRPATMEAKIRNRLREHAAITRHPRKFFHDQIPELRLGVVHLAFGNFAGQWTEFDSLKNGTVAEIHLLTEAPFGAPDRYTNHCIVTFDSNEALEYAIIDGSPDTESGNIVLCKIPDFMFTRAKRFLQFPDFAELLALQVLAALEPLSFVARPVLHFHSWESGFLTESGDFMNRLGAFETVFSPYLTAARLASLVSQSPASGWTMSRDELALASRYERKLGGACGRTVLESTADRLFYEAWLGSDRLDMRSFALERSATFATAPTDRRHLSFIAGGRPAREKGFVELCEQFAEVRSWADDAGVAVSLAILCRERRPEKGAGYIEDIERTIEQRGLKGVVTVEPKVSLEQLRRQIASATAVVVPSLYDPYCLMPTYAVEAKRPAFVSRHAGVSENVASTDFVFDPLRAGDLVRSVRAWYESTPEFRFESRFPSYRGLYVSEERGVDGAR